MESAKAHDIVLNWTVELPDTPAIPDSDLCSVIGNLLENAITACLDVTENNRFIDLSITTEHNLFLYIVVTNAFNGKAKQKDGKYLSTNRNGSGIGLSSVLSTAERYGGSAEFSHKGTEFFSDVMMKML